MQIKNAVLGSVLGLALLQSKAATPASGTLSPTAPELTYTYGPNAVSNPSGMCMAPVLACDAYALTIAIPAGSPAYRVTVSTSWGGVADDYDVALLTSTGGEAGMSAGSDNPEMFTVPAIAGTYTVRVVPFAVAGSTATTKITLTAATVPAPTPGGGSTPTPAVPKASGIAPRFKAHVAQTGLANDAGEPTLGYNPLTKRAMFIAYTQANRVTFVENLPAPADALNAKLPESCDAQWEDKSGTLTTLNTLDPLMYTDKVTGRTFNSQLSGANSLFEYTDDDGENWFPGQIGPANGGADHQGMITGPYPAGSPLANNPLYPNAFYYCSQSVAAAFCARSDDGGQTQGPGTPFKNLDCAAGGLHGHPQVAPDGTLYIPDSSQCVASTGLGGGSSGFVLAHRSTDAGLTYTQHPIPTSTGGGGSDPSIGIASDGTVYLCYENADSRAHMAVSKDRGETWINDVDIGAAAGLVATRFQAATAGDPDRAACAFLGTKTDGASSSLDFKGVWYPYIATTYDGGKTYHLVNVSPTDPVQGFGGVGPDGTNRNLLDFNDLEVDERGRTLFGYADGCIGGCVIDPAANSFAAKGTIVRQSGGRTLLAAFDNKADTQYNAATPIAPAAACAVQAKSSRTASKTVVAWNAPDDGGSAVTNYEVFRATSPAGPYTSIGNSGAKTTIEDPAADPMVALYYYRVVAENAQGKAGVSNIIELPLSVAEVVNTCVTPGQVIATSPVVATMPPDLDAVTLSVAEPPGFEGKLVVTLKMAGFTAGQPAAAFYGVLFPNRGNFYFALDTTQGPASFDYGSYTVAPQGLLVFAPAGNLDAASGTQPDGSIVFVVDKALFGDLKAGDVLSGFDVRIRAGSATATSRDTIGPADYIIRGTAICLANIAPLASLATNFDKVKPNDSISFTISGTDADAADKVAKFTLSFGDGETITDRDITTLPVMLTHKYAAAGNYMARLTVTDSRGLVSSNVASKFINVNSANPSAGTPGSVSTIGGSASPVTSATGGSGRFGGAWGIALLPLAFAALRRRRRA